MIPLARKTKYRKHKGYASIELKRNIYTHSNSSKIFVFLAKDLMLLEYP